MIEDDVTPEWIDYPTAERYCGLSYTTLWRYVSSGELKAARIGRSVRLHLPTLERFMQQRCSLDGRGGNVEPFGGAEDKAKEDAP
jgi:excisionase family DNA binding protein